MKRTYTAALTALALAAPAGAARAEGMTFTGLAWTSDYVVGGYSLNDGKPALQGYVEHNFASGLYAGIWATQTDIGTDDRVEIDLYAGYRGAWQKLSYDVAYYAYFYERSGFDYPEAILKADWNFTDNFALGGTLRAPFGGAYDGEYMYGPRITFKPLPQTTLKAEYMFNTADDLNDWNVSLRQDLTDSVALSLTYWRNDVVGSTVVGAISFDTDFSRLFGG